MIHLRPDLTAASLEGKINTLFEASAQKIRAIAQNVLCSRASRRLARAIAYAMAVRREGLRDDQGRQNRIELAGEHLLTIAATAWYAEKQERTAGHREGSSTPRST